MLIYINKNWIIFCFNPQIPTRDSSTAIQVLNFHLDGHRERSPLYSLHRDNATSQKAMSLPSSPHDYRGQTSERSGPSEYGMNDELESTWNKVLESPMFNNRPLLPYEEWKIDFSELSVGTRIGIGKFQLLPLTVLIDL